MCHDYLRARVLDAYHGVSVDVIHVSDLLSGVEKELLLKAVDLAGLPKQRPELVHKILETVSRHYPAGDHLDAVAHESGREKIEQKKTNLKLYDINASSG